MTAEFDREFRAIVAASELRAGYSRVSIDQELVALASAMDGHWQSLRRDMSEWDASVDSTQIEAALLDMMCDEEPRLLPDVALEAPIEVSGEAMRYYVWPHNDRLAAGQGLPEGATLRGEYGGVDVVLPPLSEVVGAPTTDTECPWRYCIVLDDPRIISADGVELLLEPIEVHVPLSQQGVSHTRLAHPSEVDGEVH